MLTRHLTLLLTLTAFSFSAVAQNGGYSLFRSFTVADGLPSNGIYSCVEDNKGFLWVATDAGIARFDGKRFQTFTTKDGLPDDEVLDVVKENNGRIWVNCFKQSPAYFDEIKNRFINAKEDINLAIIKGTSSMHVISLKAGGVVYRNENGSFFFGNDKSGKLFYKHPNTGRRQVIKTYSDSAFIVYGFGKASPEFLYFVNGKIQDSFSLNKWFKEQDFNYKITDGTFNMINNAFNKIYIFSGFSTNPLQCKTDSIAFEDPIFDQRFTPRYFTVISRTGKIDILDKQTLKFLFSLSGNYSPRSLLDDSKGNIWVSTVDKGLLLYKKRAVEVFAIPDNFTNTHFLSIARKSSGALLAGNYYSQIAETDGKYFILHKLSPSPVGVAWQRKIIVSQNRIFTFSEGGDFVNFLSPIKNYTGNNILSSKTAAVLNDSIIIRGAYGGLSKINVKTAKVDALAAIQKRITCIDIANGNMIYYGSTDGLYKYDFKGNKNIQIKQNHPLLSERIMSVTASSGNYVWVATASNGLLTLHNDSVVKVFSTTDGVISNSIKCLSTGRPGEIWIGTNSGISIIRYKDNLKNFTYQNLTINDGLSSNIINEMLYSNDTMYCATGNGICAIPANISLSGFNIPVQLTGVVINNRDTIISNNYSLKYNQNNIELHFAGIELGGHFNYFQYSIDGDGWQKMEANTLILQLNSGKHAVEIRAVDVNGNAGTKPLLVSFDITTPFWKATWFWVLLFLLSGGLIGWILRKREMTKREASMQDMLNQKKLTELELQALKSQINPHFIFNCLNSIKLLSHQQQHLEAEKYLDRFASLLRSAMEQSSLQQITLQEEIHFLENYLSLEKLRFPDKLAYSIEVDKSLHPGKLLVPSMLLQPYVENAVKHGIAPLKNRQGLVQVRFYQKGNTLIAEVQDNGNGIEKHNRLTEGTGIGMANTERRSSLYNIETKLVDLKTVGANLKGTLVQLTMPLITKI